MKHLVLGSSGQIGAHLVKYLVNQKQQVFEWDILNKPFQDLRQAHSPILDSYIEDCDIVHFLAFDVGGAKYLEKYQDSYDFIYNNMAIMTNTFDALRQNKKPFIFASSQMAEMSHSSYGILKLLGEKMTHELGGIVARFWNVYGYEKDLEKAHVIMDIFNQVYITTLSILKKILY